MKTRVSLLIAGSVLLLAACADSDGDGLAEGTLTLPTSVDITQPEVAAELQSELDELSDAISESEAAQDLNAAWTTLSAELAASVAAIRDDGTIAREEIESGLEDFEQRLDELDVEENVRTAWESLRSHLEQLMTTS